MSVFCVRGDAEYVRQLPWPEQVAWIEGYLYAIRMWGVWKDGVQVIGCRDHSIDQIQQELEKELN